MSISQTEIQLKEGKISLLFKCYAIPGVLAMLFLALQSIVDGFIVGKLIGTDALAAVNIASPMYATVTAVALIIGIGTQAQIGIRMGSSNYTLAKQALFSGAIGLFAFTLISSIFVNIYSEEFASFLGANDELIDDTVNYIHGIMPFIAGIAAFLFFDYQLKALGNPRFAMAVMVFTILSNILLSCIFITYFSMGIFGTGLGTGVSFTCGAIISGIVFVHSYRKNDQLRRAKACFSWRTLTHILYNGSSEGLSEIALAITTYLFNVTLLEYAGKEGLAAFTLVGYLLFIGVSTALGVADGIIPIISYNYGAGFRSRVTEILKLSARCNLMIGVFFMAVLWLFGETIITIFIDAGETKVIELAVQGAKLTSLAFLFDGFNILATSFFTAINRAGLSLAVASLRGLFLLTASIVILPKFLGIDGVWLATPLVEAITCIVACVLIRRSIRTL